MKRKEPTTGHAVFVVLGLFAIVLLGMKVLPSALQMVVFCALLWVAFHAAWLGHDMASIRSIMGQGISKALPAFSIFLLIGMVIAALMQSGTVGALIYYGLDWLDPVWFLPVGFVLCALMSVVTGTSWGTVSTLGVVFVGMAGVLGLPIHWVAGMVISGATFGDKMSPISDTTNLAAMSSEVSLYQHIGSMMYTTIPAFVLSLVVFVWAGLGFETSGSQAVMAESMQSALSSHFDLNAFWALLPVSVLFGLSFLRFSPEVSMLSAVLVAGGVAIFVQGVSGQDFMTALWHNQAPETGHEALNHLLGRGGMFAMAWTLLLALIAIALGGLLLAAGFVNVLLSAVIKGIKKATSLIFTCLLTSLASILALSEAYITLILNGQLFKKAFDDLQVDRRVLSRTLEEGNTMVVGLIPWSVAGAFYSGALDVAVLDYAPYAILNWLNPLLGLLFAFMGWGLFRRKEAV